MAIVHGQDYAAYQNDLMRQLMRQNDYAGWQMTGLLGGVKPSSPAQDENLILLLLEQPK